MTLRALTILNERWLDEVVLNTSWTNVGADTNDTFSLPAGFGDCAIMELQVLVIDVATVVALTNLGVTGFIHSKAGGVVDIVATAPWFSISATRRAAYLSPDPLVLWRQDELLQLMYPELDSNGAPTDDHSVYIKVVRVRPQLQAGAPLQLVR